MNCLNKKKSRREVRQQVYYLFQHIDSLDIGITMNIKIYPEALLTGRERSIFLIIKRATSVSYTHLRAHETR